MVKSSKTQNKNMSKVNAARRNRKSKGLKNIKKSYPLMIPNSNCKKKSITRPTYLTEEIEQELIETAEYLGTRGFGLTLSKFLTIGTELVNSVNLLDPPLTKLSTKWWKGFKSRHPNFGCCRPKGKVSLPKLIAEQNKDSILSFYVQYNILNTQYQFTPLQVWNADETGSSQKETPAYIVGNKKQKTIGGKVSVTAPHMTLLACINANGDYSPPLFIVKDDTVAQNILDKSLPNSMVITSKSGYIDESIFNDWFIHWIKWLRNTTNLPQLLIVDNCTSHIRHSTILLAKSNNVELLALPPNLTHILQPLDVGVFRSFKARIRAELGNTLIRERANKLNPGQYIGMLSEIMATTFTSNCIKDAFKAVGLFPIDENKALDRLAQRAPFIAPDIVIAKKLDGIGKLKGKIIDLKSQVARLILSSLKSTTENTGSKNRQKGVKCVLAQILTQQELKALEAPKVQKRKPCERPKVSSIVKRPYKKRVKITA